MAKAFWRAVARHAEHIEADLDLGAVGLVIDGREIAQDAVLDDGAFGTHRDGLGDQQIAVGLDVDVADEAQDAFIGMSRRQRRAQEKRGCDRDAL